jgi:hypothetical protein
MAQMITVDFALPFLVAAVGCIASITTFVYI